MIDKLNEDVETIFTDKVYMNVASPIFIESIGGWDED